MSWALQTIEQMTPEEISRNPRLCVSDTDFDEVERVLGLASQPKNADGDRRLKHKGALIYTHHVNRLRGLV